MIKTIIIDDEQPAIALIIALLNRYLPGKHLILGEASNIKEGVDLISKFKPDLVFLDVKLKGGTGFDLLNKVSDIFFEVIFTTAYSEYAIEAIKQSALDYLLKPINPIDLISAVKKFEERNKNKFELERIRLLLENIETPSSNFPKIALPYEDGYRIVKSSSIKYCEADVNYTKVCFLDDSSILVAKTLKSFCELLPEKSFIRVHKSYLVNFNLIKNYQNKEGSFVILSNDEKIPISSRKKNEVLSRLLEK